MAVPCICSVAACNKPATHRGWCGVHYGRWRRHGDPLGGGTANGEPRRYFDGVVLQHEDSECLIWPYNRNSAGYGMLWSGNDRMQVVSRLACEAVHGLPPTSQYEAAHSCGKGHEGCVNPRHLFWKTRPENFADKLTHGTHNRGERHPMARLSVGDVRQIRLLAGKYSQREIASKFGVAQTMVSAILRRKKWGWLK